MNWYSVTIKDKGAKPMRGSSYVQAEDEEKVKEIAREYMTNYLSLQGVRTIKVHGKIEDGEKEVKQLVLGVEIMG